MSTDILVWQSDTRTLNPTIPQRLIDQALEEDAAAANSEWLGQFRSDLETMFDSAALAAVTMRGRFELPPVAGSVYVAFIDPSGGRGDSMTLGIAHRDEAGIAVLDLIRERRPPFNPEEVVNQFARELRRYFLSSVVSDAYAGEWVTAAFAKVGITCEQSPLSRSELYLELLPSLNSGAVNLLDNARLLGQLAGLERRVGRSGRDAVDHPRGSHDDVANAAAGALVLAARSMAKPTLPTTFDECARQRAIPSFNMETCYLFALGGAFPGSNDPRTCGSCPGHLYAKAAHKAHCERTGEAISLRDYYRTNVDVGANPFVERVRHSAWMAQEHGL